MTKKSGRIISMAVGLLALAGLALGQSVAVRNQLGKFLIVEAPTTVTRLITSNNGLYSGVGVTAFRVTFGDQAAAANTCSWYSVSQHTGETNAILSGKVFTNSYTYLPTIPLYFEAGDSFIIENSVSGAVIEIPYFPYQ